VSDTSNPAPAFTYRAASLEDADGILTLLEEAAAEIPMSLDEPEQQGRLQIVTGECCLSEKSLIALDAAGTIVGVVLARQDTKDLKAIALLYIAVAKASRSNGVFSSLMEKLKSKPTPLTATVLSGNQSGMADRLVRKGFVKGDVSAKETKLRWDPPPAPPQQLKRHA
jgi:hypothetical protein